VSGDREVAPEPVQVVAALFVGSGCSNGVDVDATRVEQGGEATNRAAFARRITALEREHDASSLSAVGRLDTQHLGLQRLELGLVVVFGRA
jgi:hypothetical protein